MLKSKQNLNQYTTMLQGDILTPSSYRHFLLPPIKRALDWISEFGLNIEADSPEHKRHEIPDIPISDMYGMVIDAALSPLEGRQFEAHREFWDIHYCPLGMEELLWLPLQDLTTEGASGAENEYDEENDFILFPLKGNFTRIILTPGRFAIFSPGDAHIPGLRPGNQPNKAKKIVVKIHRKLFK